MTLDRSKEEKVYEELSPFELKNKLIDMAKSHRERMMLNAGRGNPNWVATFPREAFFLLGSFALEEGHRVLSRAGLAGAPDPNGIGARFETFCQIHAEQRGAQFLADAYKYAVHTLGFDGDPFVAELCDGILGDHYPVPDRMLKYAEQVVKAYLNLTMCGGNPPPGEMDLFAVEGGTAAMTYIFNTLKEQGLLNAGDKIALGTPIFTPYLEIPVLKDYELEVVEIKQDESEDWQYTDAELEKLLDPSIKAFFIVHPSNPTSVAMSEASLNKLGDIINNKRKDLIVLTDDVYGTFVPNFRSVLSVAPRNTLLVYSFSKYFGTTGWRLGVIGLYRDNVMDAMIQAQPEAQRKALHERYASIDPNPDSLRLIDRFVADSRAVALNHTAGLSTPQQVMMVMLAFQELLDAESRLYYKEMNDLVRTRFEALYKALGAPAPEPALYARYYTTIDVPKLARERFGEAFAEWLVKAHEPIDFVWRLADEKDVVLMDGGGFDAPDMSIRVSLANLYKADYENIGKAISELLDDYKNEFDQTQA